MEAQPPSRPSPAQRVFAVAVAVATLVYLYLTVSGRIDSRNRLGAADFGLVVVAGVAIAAALRPAWFANVHKVDFGGIKVELGEVRKSQIEVQKNQQEQQAILEDVRLALRLLISDNERKHLVNLSQGATTQYRVRGQLRDEIRRLRAMRLITMRGKQTVGGMPDNAVFDLAEYVELTEDGRKFAARLRSEPGVQAREAGSGG